MIRFRFEAARLVDELLRRLRVEDRWETYRHNRRLRDRLDWPAYRARLDEDRAFRVECSR